MLRCLQIAPFDVYFHAQMSPDWTIWCVIYKNVRGSMPKGTAQGWLSFPRPVSRTLDPPLMRLHISKFSKGVCPRLCAPSVLILWPPFDDLVSLDTADVHISQTTIEIEENILYDMLTVTHCWQQHTESEEDLPHNEEDYVQEFVDYIILWRAVAVGGIWGLYGVGFRKGWCGDGCSHCDIASESRCKDWKSKALVPQKTRQMHQ